MMSGSGSSRRVTARREKLFEARRPRAGYPRSLTELTLWEVRRGRIKASSFLFSSSSSLAPYRRSSNPASSSDMSGYFGAARAKTLMAHGALWMGQRKGRGVEGRDDRRGGAGEEVGWIWGYAGARNAALGKEWRDKENRDTLDWRDSILGCQYCKTNEQSVDLHEFTPNHTEAPSFCD